jgi:hypothetical protein
VKHRISVAAALSQSQNKLVVILFELHDIVEIDPVVFFHPSLSLHIFASYGTLQINIRPYFMFLLLKLLHERK